MSKNADLEAYDQKQQGYCFLRDEVVKGLIMLQGQLSQDKESDDFARELNFLIPQLAQAKMEQYTEIQSKITCRLKELEVQFDKRLGRIEAIVQESAGEIFARLNDSVFSK